MHQSAFTGHTISRLGALGTAQFDPTIPPDRSRKSGESDAPSRRIRPLRLCLPVRETRRKSLSHSEEHKLFRCNPN